MIDAGRGMDVDAYTGYYPARMRRGKVIGSVVVVVVVDTIIA